MGEGKTGGGTSEVGRLVAPFLYDRLLDLRSEKKQDGQRRVNGFYLFRVSSRLHTNLFWDFYTVWFEQEPVVPVLL